MRWAWISAAGFVIAVISDWFDSRALLAIGSLLCLIACVGLLDELGGR